MPDPSIMCLYNGYICLQSITGHTFTARANQESPVTGHLQSVDGFWWTSWWDETELDNFEPHCQQLWCKQQNNSFWAVIVFYCLIFMSSFPCQRNSCITLLVEWHKWGVTSPFTWYWKAKTLLSHSASEMKLPKTYGKNLRIGSRKCFAHYCVENSNFWFDFLAFNMQKLLWIAR